MVSKVHRQKKIWKSQVIPQEHKKVLISRQTLYLVKAPKVYLVENRLGETRNCLVAESFEVPKICCVFIQGPHQCTYCTGISWLLQLR